MFGVGKKGPVDLRGSKKRTIGFQRKDEELIRITSATATINPPCINNCGADNSTTDTIHEPSRPNTYYQSST